MIKNVVVVSDFPYIVGGAEKVAITSAVALAEAGMNVIFFCGKGPACDELRLSEVKVICTNQEEASNQNKLKGFAQGVCNSKAEKMLLEVLNGLNNSETVVHCHTWSKILSGTIFRATKKAKCPVVITGHDYATVCPLMGMYDLKKNEICSCKPLGLQCICTNCDGRKYPYKVYKIIRQFINKLYIRGNDLHYFYISEFSKSKIKQNLPWPAKEHFVLNPVEVNFIQKADVANNDAFLFLGRVIQVKGIPIFCEAVKKKNVRGIVVGDGPMLEELKAEYPSVEFAGWKCSSEITEYALQAKALIVPSVWYETAVLTIPEVMGRYCLPCIVSDACAGKEFIVEGKSGYVFKSGDVDDLVAKMNRVDNEAEHLQEYIEKEFDRDLYYKETHAKKLIEEYNKILIQRSVKNTRMN